MNLRQPWLRRAAILFQLNYKKETDFELLSEIILENLDSKEFFINKAIGWSLRQYARVDPRAVKKFVKSTSLHPLSRREAMKHLEDGDFLRAWGGIASLQLGLSAVWTGARARDLTIDVVKSLARYGPRRFYILNTGISTLRALQPAAESLAKEGVILRYTDLLKITGPVEKAIGKQEGGTHADEIETSMMLYMAPSTVDMKKAAKDYHPSNERGLTRNPNGRGVYSATGIYGDATLATKAKGEQITKALVTGILKDIEDLRQASATEPPK